MNATNQEINLKNIDLLNLQNLLAFNPVFFVADYQRGYRWDKQQVTQLLNDINQNPKGKTYCLQPIMLTPCNVNTIEQICFEVIDGQQRLTTIFLILKVLSQRLALFSIPYSINYATRKSCINFLKNIHSHAFVNNSEDIEPHWKLIDKENQNIDNYHLFNAYQTINLWFDTFHINENVFLDKLMADVKLIWYPVITTAELNAKKMFRNINSGKIRLTSSDLIKALFVLQYQALPVPLQQRNQLKQEFSNQWNEIERQLNNDGFWCFITNHEKVNYSTRIGLIFDLVTGSNCNENASAAYLKYAEGKVPLDWKRIVDVFRKIHEWSTDEKYYHRIGFLINANRKSFATILDLYEKNKQKPKSAFYEIINDEVVQFTKSFELEKINYQAQPNTCKNVLLLYNILIFEKDFPQQKFPFDKYVNEFWSLEHIHPQNPQEFTRMQDVVFWLQDTKKVLQNKNNSKNEDLPVLHKIDLFLEKAAIEENSYNNEAKEAIREIKDLLEIEVATHKINNLVLLDKVTNSTLGNGLFKTKRDIILKTVGTDKGNYIPYATVNCFVKKYTEKDSLQNEFWSEADAEYYYTSIKKIIYGE